LPTSVSFSSETIYERQNAVRHILCAHSSIPLWDGQAFLYVVLLAFVASAGRGINVNEKAEYIGHQPRIIEEWHECYLSEYKKLGYVATLKMPEGHQRFWGLNDVDNLLVYSKKHQKSDVYLSLNGFAYGDRSVSSMMQGRNIGIDVDPPKLGLAVKDAVEKLKQYVMQGKIPNPNLLIYSGGGIQPIYTIAGGASPKMGYLMHYITIQYISLLREIGSDPAASDLARMLRMPGTVNTKYGVEVKVEIWRQLEYSLQDLYEFCTPIEQAQKRGKRRKGSIAIFTGKKGVKTLYSLNAARVSDLQKLVEIRGGDLTGCRNTFIYIYSFTVCLFLKSRIDTADFIQPILERIYSRTDKPMKKSEINATIKSACNDAIEFMEAFAANEFSMRGLPRTLIKPMKNETVINKLNIMDDEIKQMRTIITAEESYSRRVQKRRESGIKERQEYLSEQAEITDNKLFLLEQAMRKYPNAINKELAEILSVSVRQIQRLKKKIQG